MPKRVKRDEYDAIWPSESSRALSGWFNQLFYLKNLSPKQIKHERKFRISRFSAKKIRISHTQNQLTWFCSFRRKQQSLAPFSVKLGSGENIPFRRYNAGSAHFGKILLISRNHFAKPVVAKKFAGIDFAKPKIRFRSCLLDPGTCFFGFRRNYVKNYPLPIERNRHQDFFFQSIPFPFK